VYGGLPGSDSSLKAQVGCQRSKVEAYVAAKAARREAMRRLCEERKGLLKRVRYGFAILPF
jgi:hypothetical protein